MWLWMYWWEMWIRATMLPLEIAASSGPVRTITPETAEYLVRELYEDFDLMGVQGIIDEGGRR